MKKEKSKYLLHPSNDMLLNSKILKDINGRGLNERSSGWLLGIGIAAFICLISVNFLNENLTFGNFSLKKLTDIRKINVAIPMLKSQLEPR